MKINKILHDLGDRKDELPTTSHEAIAHVTELLSRIQEPHAAWAKHPAES